MGRFLEGGTVAVAGGAAGVSGAAGSVNPVTGVFGSGQVKWFFKDGSFVVPADVTSVRVRLWGGGGRGGGGFAIKTITGLTPGASIPVTVGDAGGNTISGGTSSFASYVSATGGSGIDPYPGGTGVGGDFNSQGGAGAVLSGGGAAGIFGDGGAAGPSGSLGGNGNSGGGSGSNQHPGGNGVSGRGGVITGESNSNGPANGEIGIVTSLDFIATGGGGGNTGSGANGGGGGSGGGGAGGFPGGGSLRYFDWAKAGRGLVIVEW